MCKSRVYSNLYPLLQLLRTYEAIALVHRLLVLIVFYYSVEYTYVD